jgi:hypothetical protein
VLVLVLKVVAAHVRVFSCSNVTAAISIVATFVVVMPLVNFSPTDFMCKARRVDWGVAIMLPFIFRADYSDPQGTKKKNISF